MKHGRLSIALILVLTVSWAFETEGLAEEAVSSKSQTVNTILSPAGPVGAAAKASQKPRGSAGPVADTVLSPLGGYGTAPPPDSGPYDAPDLAPITELNKQLPSWIQFGLEERFRWERPSGSGFKPNNDDSYFLNRLRLGMSFQPTGWLKVVAQFQDARPMFLKPPVGPPNEVK